MQLHPDNGHWEKERELLENHSVIGFGTHSGTKIQRKQFKMDVDIGDIILINRFGIPIALVEVTGNYSLNHKINDLVWFEIKRKVKVLEFSQNTTKKLLPILNTYFRKSSVKSNIYQYIHNWYNTIIQKKYSNQNLKHGEYKIKEFHIENHKIIKDLTLKLTDFNDIALPIVVIAGKNGMGKTTLLEFLSNCDLSLHDYIHIYKTKKSDITYKLSNPNKAIIENNKIMVGVQGILASKKEYRENVLFLPVDIDGIDNLEQLIIKHFNTMFRLHNKRMDEITTELQEKISKIFKGLDLTFNFSRLDTDDQVYFKNKQGQEFPASNLSTGEKTLLSKILYLALYNVKNKIILIDEPELSLHPIWQEKVLGIYKAFAKHNNNQIIIATHSPHIIGSADNKYIRILREINGKIEVINDVTAYGRDIQWVLKEVMGSQYTRSKTITDELEHCQTLLDNEKYNEVEQCINSLEARIGNDDNDIMDLRNSLFFERD